MSFTSPMSRLLAGLLAQLTNPAHGLADPNTGRLIEQGVITRVEQPCTAYPFVQLIPYAVDSRDGDAEARVAVILYCEFAVEGDAVLGLYDFAHNVAQWVKSHGDQFADGVELQVNVSNDIGERIEPDGQGGAVPVASYITVFIEPEWLEDFD